MIQTSGLFHWDFTTKILSADASTLGRSGNFMTDGRMTVISDHTGEAVTFQLVTAHREQTDYEIGDLTHWSFKPLDRDLHKVRPGTTLIVWNT